MIQSKTIFLLTDYKGNFGSKYTAYPYRSGMDKDLLRKYFSEFGYKIEYLHFNDIDFRNLNYDAIYLFTSSEDNMQLYKGYIEDIVFGLELSGVYIIPKYKYLRANNNKVMMEILRDISTLDNIKLIQSNHFGSYDEFLSTGMMDKNLVYKSAFGAKSVGVGKGTGIALRKSIKRISRNRKFNLKDYLRIFIHRGYARESNFLKKFIVQNFIENLNSDYKILIFGSKYYVLQRYNRKNDFRASGSGKFVFNEQVPFKILDYAKYLFEGFIVPNASFDIAIDGDILYLLEFQFIFFGTTTIEKAPFYFTFENNEWTINYKKSILEEEYVISIVEYMNKT